MSEMDERNGQKTEYTTGQKRKDFWGGVLIGIVLVVVYFFLGFGLGALASQGGLKGVLDLVTLAALVWVAVHLIRIKRYFFVIGGLVGLVALPLLVFGACLVMLSGSGF